MQIIQNIENTRLTNTIITTGNFDGVHLGHQALIKQLTSLAKSSERKSVIVMFNPHPREILGLGELNYLSDNDGKINLLSSLNVDILVQLPFTKEMAKWGTEKFVKEILIDHLGMQHFLTGFNHRLGNPTKPADLNILAKKYNFTTNKGKALNIEGENISSSLIRKDISLGKVAKAAKMLGRSYTLPCTVIEGMKIGRTIDIPTANLKLTNPKMQLPMEGVYAARLETKNGIYDGMLQIGHRPTFEDQRGLSIEIHLFNFNNIIYHEYVTLHLIFFFRTNIKFDSIGDLKRQLKADKTLIESYFKTNQPLNVK